MDTTPPPMLAADAAPDWATGGAAEMDARRTTRWLVVTFIVLLLVLAWLAGADHAVGSLLHDPSACGGG